MSSPQSDPNPAAPKTWHVGTLTYTTGGVVVLFLLLLLGDFAWSMRDRSVGPMAQWYLSSLSVPNVVFGLLLTSFPALIGLILGPIISVKSDRHRGKRGRRLPFLLITTPFAALGMIGLGLTPFIARWAHGVFAPGHPFGQWFHGAMDGNPAGNWLLRMVQNEMVVSVVCFGIFWAAFEFATIAGQAVFGGLINDVVPRPLLGRFFGLFRAVSLIDGMIFNYWLMGLVPTHYTVIFIAIGVFYGSAFLWVCLKVREGEYPPPPPAVPVQRNFAAGFAANVRLYFKECFSNSYYVWVFFTVMIAALAFFPVNAFSIPYAKSLGLSMDTYGKGLALTFLISLCMSYFIGWLADIFHPLRMAMVSLAGYAVVTLVGSLYATSAESFLVAWVLHGVLSGCYMTSAASLGQRLYPQSKFAQFASAGGIVASLTHMVVAPAMGLLIDVSGNAYRFTFVAGCALAVVGLISLGVVYGKFLKLGGPKDYVAPE
ncbi:MAG: MFS transporter [Terrimicrobiaceae bacterium]